MSLRLFNRRNIRKKLENLQQQWGKPKSDAYHFDWIRAYANALNLSSFHQLTEQTIEDIDFYNLFAFIDRTTSKIGQQFLFKRVTQPTNSSIDELVDFTKKFSAHSALREEVQLELIKLNHSDAYYIPSLIRTKLLERPKWLNLL